MAASINYPGNLDTDATVGGGNEPDGTTALDATDSGHPKHSVLHQNLGEAIQKIETKVGKTDSTPSANTVLASGGTGESAWTATPTVTTLTATNMTLGGQDLGEIVSFTPTWTNIGGSFESNQGYYAYLKDMIYVSIEAELSASNTVGDVRVDLEVAGSDTHQAANSMLQVQLFDSDANRYYQGMTTPIDSNTVQVRYNIVDGNEIFGQPTTSSAPFTWADGDKILITGFYRIGS